MAHRREFVTRRAVAKFRLVAEREQGLMAARCLGRARNGENLIDGKECAFAAARRPRENAIMADVPAQSGQRNEGFGRKGDGVAMGQIAPGRGGHHQ